MQHKLKNFGLTAFAICLMLLVSLAWSETKPGQEQVTSALETAIFAGGCFWCMEPPFDKLDGVVSTISGYTGGHLANPGYKQVSAGGTGHFEALQVTYDPTKITYATLLNVFLA